LSLPPEVSRSLTLGQIGTAQGIKGWVMVNSFTDPPESLLDHPVWQLESPRGEIRTVKLLEGAPHQARFRVHLDGVNDRDAALALTGWWVKVAREALPALQEREHYRDDLLGFEVRNLEGVMLGKVDHFIDLPAGSVMVVRGEREHWVSATAQHLKTIDVAGRSILVDWPADL
jgi:16S rRNA processing protein RimM